MQTKTKEQVLFIFLQVIAWVFFIGLSIEAGGLIVNFVFSLFKPDFIQHLYQKLDLTDLYQRSQLSFFGLYGFILVIAILKALLFYVAIRLMSKMDLSKPFNSFVSKQISFIAYYTLSIGLLSHIARATANALLGANLLADKLNTFWDDGQAYILMAAVIYIIATIFKRGVEIQNENDLTV
jgi:hypothetical protein